MVKWVWITHGKRKLVKIILNEVITLSEEIYTNFTTKNAELYHHGIEGQKWGIRNGPPYPLDSNGDAKRAKKINKVNYKVQKEENKYTKMVRKTSSKFDKNINKLNRQIGNIDIKVDKILNSNKENKDILAAAAQTKLKNKIRYRDALQTMQKGDPDILYAAGKRMRQAYRNGVLTGWLLMPRGVSGSVSVVL